MRYRASASPAFVEHWLSAGPIEQTLRAAPMLVFDRNDELQDRFLKALTGDSASGGQIRHLIPTSEAFLSGVERGLGWGMIPDEQTALLPEGALVELAPGHAVEVPLYWQQWKLDSPALKALSDAVISATRGFGRKLAQ
jgi:LysR family transcriptional regulator (chromosome initiation inhibitor)